MPELYKETFFRQRMKTYLWSCDFVVLKTRFATSTPFGKKKKTKQCSRKHCFRYPGSTVTCIFGVDFEISKLQKRKNIHVHFKHGQDLVTLTPMKISLLQDSSANAACLDTLWQVHGSLQPFFTSCHLYPPQYFTAPYPLHFKLSPASQASKGMIMCHLHNPGYVNSPSSNGDGALLLFIISKLVFDQPWREKVQKVKTSPHYFKVMT